MRHRQLPFWNKCSGARPLSVTSYWPTWIWREAWSAAGLVVGFLAFLVRFLVRKCHRVLVQIDWPFRNKTLAKMWLHQLRLDCMFYDKLLKVHLTPKYFFCLNKSLHLFETHCAFLNQLLKFFQVVKVTKSSHDLSHDWARKGHGSIPGLMSQTDLHRFKSL